jgi:hypothetical protein
MPWHCGECGADVLRDDPPVCPGCGTPKTSWTVVEDQTRTLRVAATRKFEVLTGAEPDEVAYDQATWAPTEVARALPRAKARSLAARGRLPAPRDVLVVRVTAKGPRSARDVHLTVVPDARREREVDVPAPEAEGDKVDVRLVAVFGDPAEGEPPLALPGLAVVDVSDATDPGLAPTLEVAAAGKPARTVRLEAAPRTVALAELEDALFRTESAVLLPDGHDPEGAGADPDRPPASGVGVLASFLRHLDEHPGEVALVAGHTDTTGDAAWNLALSRQRAAAGRAALAGDREAYAKVAHERHTVADEQQVLRWVAATRGYPCDPGPIDGKAGPKLTAAVRAFQQAYDDDAPVEDLKVDGVLGPRTWAALFDCLERGLQAALGVDAAGLAALRAKLSFVEPAEVGCGEHHPLDEPTRDAYRSQTNRRVELLLFDPADAPALPCHAGGGCDPAACDLYAAGAYERRHLPLMASALPWVARWEGLAAFGSEARLVCDAPGLPAGTPMTLVVEQVGAGVVASLEATSSEGRVEATFGEWYHPDKVAPPVQVQAPDAFPPVQFVFTVRGAGREVRSAPLVYSDQVHVLLLRQEDGQPMPDQPFTLRTPWGTWLGTTDGEATAFVDGLPPGGAHVLVGDSVAVDAAAGAGHQQGAP